MQMYIIGTLQYELRLGPLSLDHWTVVLASFHLMESVASKPDLT